MLIIVVSRNRSSLEHLGELVAVSTTRNIRRAATADGTVDCDSGKVVLVQPTLLSRGLLIPAPAEPLGRLPLARLPRYETKLIPERSQR